MKQLVKLLFLGLIFGLIYYGIEVLFVGYSSYYMIAVGGLAGICCGLINEDLDRNLPLSQQMLVGCLIITAVELVCGIVLNLGFGLMLWDYSNKMFNLMGQICLQNSVYWYFLSSVAIILDDYLRYWFFDEEKPSYKLF